MARQQGLAGLTQDDFAAGSVRSIARHLIPANGAYSIENGLLDDDGSIYRRGGSEYMSNAAFGTSLRWVWDGYLPVGQRTVFANNADFGVLAADNVTPVNLGGAGLAAPVRAVVAGGMLFIPGGVIYGGSRKTADYSTGTVTVTNASKTVTGAGTTWLANVDAGMLLRVAGAGRYYAVASVESNTSLTLVDAYEATTAAGQAYVLSLLGSAAAPYRVAGIYATVAERLVTVEGTRISFSEGRSALNVLQPHVFTATDYHELPDGATGLGAEALRDLLVVFASDGVWVVNNMAFDLTDAAGNVQQSMQRTSQDVLLWGPAGVASFGGALVVPAVDGVYLVDGISPPVPVGESVRPLIEEHVRAGRKPGGAAVFKGHLFLPVLDSSDLVVDLLVCRLDRPVKVRGRAFFPWSWFRGHGGNVAALTSRIASGAARQPELLGAGRGDGRVLKLTGVFEPTVGRKADADASVHRWMVETRDYATGAGNVNTVRRATVRYELVDAAADNPVIRGYYSIGQAETPGSQWGLFNWGAGVWSDVSLAEFAQLPGAAPEDSGRNRYVWRLAARSRFVRLRLESTDPAARLVLRSAEVSIRSSGKDR